MMPSRKARPATWLMERFLTRYSDSVHTITSIWLTGRGGGGQGDGAGPFTQVVPLLGREFDLGGDYCQVNIAVVSVVAPGARTEQDDAAGVERTAYSISDSPN